jgi:signal transduction histidine kinase
VLVAFLVPLALLVRSAAADRALTAAIVEAQSLAPVVVTTDEADLPRLVDAQNAGADHALTVFLPDGKVIGAPAVRSATVEAAAQGQSLNAVAPGGREIAVAVSGLDQGTAVIRTFVPDAELEAGVGRSWLVLSLLGLGLLAMSVLIADWLGRSLTRPLSAVATVSYRLAQGSLGARAADDGTPEVRQVSAGLNQLAGRISELLAQERATVADLSHRLRTPLTALRIDVESLTDAQTRARLVADLDAVDRTVDDVIRQADRPSRSLVAVSCDATAVVRERVHFWSVLADEERRQVGVILADRPTPVRISEADLSACVDALIGNVFAHTPAGSPFEVYLAPVAGGGAALTVSDSGPGMADAAVLRRGASGAGSTGLGLDIVARTAETAGGAITIGRSRAGGARVSVTLGAPLPPIVRSHRELGLTTDRGPSA